MKAPQRIGVLTVVICIAAMTTATTQATASPTITPNGTAVTLTSSSVSLVVTFLGSSVVTITCTAKATGTVNGTTSISVAAANITFFTCTATVLGKSCVAIVKTSGTWTITINKFVSSGSYTGLIGVGGATIDLSGCIAGCTITVGAQSLPSSWTNATSPATTKDLTISTTLAFTSSGCGVSVTSATFTGNYSTTDNIVVTGS